MRILKYIFLNSLGFLFLGNTSIYCALAALPQNAIIKSMKAFEQKAIEYALFTIQEAREAGSAGNKVVDFSNDEMLDFFVALNQEKMPIEKPHAYKLSLAQIDHIKWNLATDILLFKLLLQYIPTKAKGLFAGWGKKRTEVTGADKQELLKEVEIFLSAFKQDEAFKKYVAAIAQLIEEPSTQAAFKAATTDATLLSLYQGQHAVILAQYTTFKVSLNPFVKFLDTKIAQLKQLMVSTDPNYASEPTLFDEVMQVLVAARAQVSAEDITSAADRKAILAKYNSAKAAAIKTFNKKYLTPKGTAPKGGLHADATPAGGLSDIVKQKAAITVLGNRLSKNAAAGTVVSAGTTDNLSKRVTDAQASIDAGTPVDASVITALQKDVADALQAHKNTGNAAPISKLHRQEKIIARWEKVVQDKIAEGIAADSELHEKLKKARVALTSSMQVAADEMHEIKKAVEKFSGKKVMPPTLVKELSEAQEIALQKMQQDIATPVLESAAAKDAEFAAQRAELAEKIDQYLTKNVLMNGSALMSLQAAVLALIAKGKKIAVPTPPAKPKPLPALPQPSPDVVPEPIDPVVASRMVHELAESLALLHSYETI